MLVADLEVEDEYIVVDQNTTVREVAKKIMGGEISTALITDGPNNVVGAISVDIMVQKITVEVRNPIETKVKTIMDKNVIRVKKSTDIKAVEQRIIKFKPAAVVVVSEDGKKILGYVSPFDMVEALQEMK